MNENIDLTKILKDCPKGWKFYSSVYGEVDFVEIMSISSPYLVIFKSHGSIHSATSTGKHFEGKGECTFFPSREQRDWSKFTAPWYKKKRFDPNTLKPFDKVLVRYNSDDMWQADFYSNKSVCKKYPYKCISSLYTYCIPYNDDTKHLLGTTEEAPEYYRYWED